MPEPKKTLDQITKDALSSNFGISDADLALLFEDDTGNEPATSSDAPAALPSDETVPPAQPATTAQPAQTPVVSTVTATPPPEPVRAVDNSSLENKLAEINTLVQELSRRLNAQQQPATTQVQNPADDVDDQAIIQKPKESIMKMLMGTLKVVLPAAFAEYDSNVQKRVFVDAFRQQHPDFEELRPLMRQIVAENPSNDDVYALPRVYEEAQRRRKAQIESMKKELNIPATAASQPAQPVLDEDAIAKLEQRLAERIRKRRAVSGTLTADQTAPVSPADRQTVTPKEKPLTEDEKMFMDMLNSGPPSTKFLKGLELAANRK